MPSAPLPAPPAVPPTGSPVDHRSITKVGRAGLENPRLSKQNTPHRTSRGHTSGHSPAEGDSGARSHPSGGPPNQSDADSILAGLANSLHTLPPHVRSSLAAFLAAVTQADQPISPNANDDHLRGLGVANPNAGGAQ